MSSFINANRRSRFNRYVITSTEINQINETNADIGTHDEKANRRIYQDMPSTT